MSTRTLLKPAVAGFPLRLKHYKQILLRIGKRQDYAMAILAYITDLFFQAKVGQTAKTAGVELKIVSSLYHFLPRLEENPSMILIDLNADGISPSTLITQIKEKKPQLPVICYGAHVDTEAFEQARKAGADQVLARSKLSKDLPEILTQYAGE